MGVNKLSPLSSVVCQVLCSTRCYSKSFVFIYYVSPVEFWPYFAFVSSENILHVGIALLGFDHVVNNSSNNNNNLPWGFFSHLIFQWSSILIRIENGLYRRIIFSCLGFSESFLCLSISWLCFQMLGGALSSSVFFGFCHLGQLDPKVNYPTCSEASPWMLTDPKDRGIDVLVQ